MNNANHPLLLSAINTVLCAPNEESQLLFQLAKVTSALGAYDFYYDRSTTIPMPIKGAWYHVYKVGLMLPTHVTETLDLSNWISFTDVINQTDTLCELYTVNGLVLPKGDAWLRDIGRGNVIVAIIANPVLKFKPNKEPVFLRTYRNSLYDIPRPDPFNLTSDYVRVTSVYDAVRFKNNSPTGLGVSLYHNGLCVTEFDIPSIHVGARLEWVKDDTVSDVLRYPVSELTTFTSVMDSCSKLILFTDGSNDGTIRHERDIDVYIEDSVTGISALLHRNDNAVVRMVDYKDYAIKEAAVRAYLNILPKTTAYSKLNIVLRRRKSGFEIMPIDDRDCTLYLQHLPATSAKSTINGAGAQLQRWRASSLEKSPYTKLLGSKIPQLTIPSIQEAYGYGWTNLTLASGVFKTPLASADYDLPPAFQNGMFTLEYDDEGKLLRYNRVPSTAIEFISLDCKLVEMIEGDYVEVTNPNTLWSSRGMVTGYTDAPIKLGYVYRFYQLVHDPILRKNKLVDVTGSSEYEIVNGAYRWILNNTPSIIERYIISDEYASILKFDLATLTGDVKSVKLGSDIPFLTDVFDVYVDGHALVPNIEYSVCGDQLSLLLVTAASGSELIVVQSGFPVLEGEHSFIKSETGYTYNGTLSPDKRSKLFENKVQKLIVGGKVILFDPSMLSEYHQTGPLESSKPYHIRDVFNPMRGLIQGNPYDFYKASLVIETEIDDYLDASTIYATPLTSSVITDKLCLFSPFIASVIGLLKSPAGISSADLVTMQGFYSDDFVTRLVSPLLALLKFLEIGLNEIDTDYCRVKPHFSQTPIELNDWKYRFLERVIQLYSAKYVTIESDVLINPSLP